MNAIITDDLKSRERIIQSGLNTFYAVGIALSEIKNMGLFLQTHSTWDEYCRERWNMAARTAYQTIKSASVVANLMSQGSSVLPALESVARELISVPSSDRKKVWLEAVEQCPDITAAQLKSWLRRRYHVKDGMPRAKIVHRCPNCSHEYEPENLAGKSRGNRTPSKTPSIFYREFGRFGTAIDYGCGRMRNADEIGKGADDVLFCDFPEQIERIYSNGRRVESVPIKDVADVVFLIQVAHIQRDERNAESVVRQASMHATQYLVIDYPFAQFNHAKESSGYLRLSSEIISGFLPDWEVIFDRWAGRVNKILVLKPKELRLCNLTLDI